MINEVGTGRIGSNSGDGKTKQVNCQHKHSSEILQEFVQVSGASEIPADEKAGSSEDAAELASALEKPPFCEQALKMSKSTDANRIATALLKKCTCFIYNHSKPVININLS